MSKVQVRFPNECNFQEVDFDLSMFKVHNNYQDEVFGYYGNMYISIKKKTLPKGFLGE
jgi:hypothetical protein